MKQPDVNPCIGPNWAWPQKTWFQERLNGLKALKQKTHQKPGGSPQNLTPVEAKPRREGGPEEGEPGSDS